MEKLLDGLRLVLASASPRRRELLCQIGAQVRIASTKEVDESYPENIAPEEVAPYISAKKAHAYADSIESGETLITADTVVICEGRVLGKPHNEHEAVEMLRQLSGRTHLGSDGRHHNEQRTRPHLRRNHRSRLCPA